MEYCYYKPFGTYKFQEITILTWPVNPPLVLRYCFSSIMKFMAIIPDFTSCVRPVEGLKSWMEFVYRNRPGMPCVHIVGNPALGKDSRLPVLGETWHSWQDGWTVRSFRCCSYTFLYENIKQCGGFCGNKCLFLSRRAASVSGLFNMIRKDKLAFFWARWAECSASLNQNFEVSSEFSMSQWINNSAPVVYADVTISCDVTGWSHAPAVRRTANFAGRWRTAPRCVCRSVPFHWSG